MLKQLIKKSGIYRNPLAIYPYISWLNLSSGKSFKAFLLGKFPSRKIVISRSNQQIWISEKHFYYSENIIHDFDSYFNAVEPEQNGGMMIVDYSISKVHTMRPSGEPFFFSSFAEIPDEVDIYLKKGDIHEGDIVLDLGAYCGYTSYKFSQAVGNSGHVYSLEPDPENYKALCKNIEYFSLNNVTPINKGVWSQSGTTMFQGEGNMGSSVSQVIDRSTNLFPVNLISLSDLCRQYEIEHVDFIKMDIEGSEVEVLRSAESFFSHYQPSIILEVHKINGRMATADVIQILSSFGYTSENVFHNDIELPLIFSEKMK